MEYDAEATAVAASQQDLAVKRQRNVARFETQLESIYEKYGRNFDDIADEIDIETGEIVVNRGHLERMRHEYDDGTNPNGVVQHAPRSSVWDSEDVEFEEEGDEDLLALEEYMLSEDYKSSQKQQSSPHRNRVVNESPNSFTSPVAIDRQAPVISDVPYAIAPALQQPNIVPSSALNQMMQQFTVNIAQQIAGFVNVLVQQNGSPAPPMVQNNVYIGDSQRHSLHIGQTPRDAARRQHVRQTPSRFRESRNALHRDGREEQTSARRDRPDESPSSKRRRLGTPGLPSLWAETKVGRPPKPYSENDRRPRKRGPRPAAVSTRKEMSLSEFVSSPAGSDKEDHSHDHTDPEETETDARPGHPQPSSPMAQRSNKRRREPSIELGEDGWSSQDSVLDGPSQNGNITERVTEINRDRPHDLQLELEEAAERDFSQDEDGDDAQRHDARVALLQSFRPHAKTQDSTETKADPVPSHRKAKRGRPSIGTTPTLGQQENQLKSSSVKKARPYQRSRLESDESPKVKKYHNNRLFWTKEADGRLLHLKDVQGKSWRDTIAILNGPSRTAVYEHYRFLKRMGHVAPEKYVPAKRKSNSLTKATAADQTHARAKRAARRNSTLSVESSAEEEGVGRANSDGSLLDEEPFWEVRPRTQLVRWTREEDVKLKELVEDDSLSWEDVADRMPGRTLGALQVRYGRCYKWPKPIPKRQKKTTEAELVDPVSNSRDANTLDRLQLGSEVPNSSEAEDSEHPFGDEDELPTENNTTDSIKHEVARSAPRESIEASTDAPNGDDDYIELVPLSPHSESRARSRAIEDACPAPIPNSSQAQTLIQSSPIVRHQGGRLQLERQISDIMVRPESVKLNSEVVGDEVSDGDDRSGANDEEQSLTAASERMPTEHADSINPVQNEHDRTSLETGPNGVPRELSKIVGAAMPDLLYAQSTVPVDTDDHRMSSGSQTSSPRRIAERRKRDQAKHMSRLKFATQTKPPLDEEGVVEGDALKGRRAGMVTGETYRHSPSGTPARRSATGANFIMQLTPYKRTPAVEGSANSKKSSTGFGGANGLRHTPGDKGTPTSLMSKVKVNTPGSLGFSNAIASPGYARANAGTEDDVDF